MGLERLVDQYYTRLSANDRELLTCIFREKETVRSTNSTQLAGFLHISRTTLVRLLKKPGIDTYAEFKLLMAQKETSAVEAGHLRERTKFQNKKLCSKNVHLF